MLITAIVTTPPPRPPETSADHSHGYKNALFTPNARTHRDGLPGSREAHRD